MSVSWFVCVAYYIVFVHEIFDRYWFIPCPKGKLVDCHDIPGLFGFMTYVILVLIQYVGLFEDFFVFIWLLSLVIGLFLTCVVTFAYFLVYKQ